MKKPIKSSSLNGTSFLCVVVRKSKPTCMVLASLGDYPRVGPYNPDYLFDYDGFYVWDGRSYRKADAADFGQFGFPCPGYLAIQALVHVSLIAVEGIQRTLQVNMTRPYLTEIRAEAIRGLALEGITIQT